MARRVREEVVCDAPGCGSQEGVKTCEVRLGGPLYRPDWCREHRTQVRALLGKVKPSRQRRSNMVPVNPAEIPRVP